MRSSDYDPSKADNGYDAGSIIWTYANGVDGPLRDPNTARFITTGSLAGGIAITDCGSESQSVVLVDYDTKKTLDTIDLRTFARPGYVSPTTRRVLVTHAWTGQAPCGSPTRGSAA